MTTGKRVTRGKFKIGDWVVVRATVELVRDQGGKVAQRSEAFCPVAGQVVGVTVRMEGKIETDYDDGPYGGHYEPRNNYLAVTAQHELWEVRLGMKNRSALAFEDDVKACAPGELPWLKINWHSWTAADRARQSEDSKAWPRGPDGRWVGALVAKVGSS